MQIHPATVVILAHQQKLHEQRLAFHAWRAAVKLQQSQRNESRLAVSAVVFGFQQLVHRSGPISAESFHSQAALLFRIAAQDPRLFFRLRNLVPESIAPEIRKSILQTAASMVVEESSPYDREDGTSIMMSLHLSSFDD